MGFGLFQNELRLHDCVSNKTPAKRTTLDIWNEKRDRDRHGGRDNTVTVSPSFKHNDAAVFCESGCEVNPNAEKAC